MTGLHSSQSLSKRQQKISDALQHQEQWHNRIIFSGQMQLKEQSTQADKASNGKYAYRRRYLLSDVDLSLSDMVQHSKGLWRC